MNDRARWRRIALQGLFGASFAAVVIGFASGGNVDRMTFGDGRLHRVVAADLDADDENVSPRLVGSGPSLRYGRIGFPAVLWAASGGREAAMRFVQPALMVLCAAGIAVATAVLLQTRSPWMAMAPFVAVGLSAPLAGGFAEPLAVLLALIGVILVERKRTLGATAALMCAVFTRENAVVVVVGVVVWLALHRRLRDAATLSLSVVPVAIWHLIVDQRFGHLPLRDPWLIDTGALGVPVVAVGQAVGRVSASGVVVVVAHLLIAAVAFRLWRKSVLGAIAAIAALPMLSVGELSWRYIGDASRLAVFLQVFVILALARSISRTRTAGHASK